MLTPTVATRIITAVQTGTPVSTATRYAGVDESTLYKWRKASETALLLTRRKRSASQQRLVEFFQSLDQAVAECGVRMQTIVFQAANAGDVVRDPDGAVVHMPTPEERRLGFQASTWWLSHRMASDYRTSAEITGPEGTPVVQTASITDVITAMTRAKGESEEEE